MTWAPGALSPPLLPCSVQTGPSAVLIALQAHCCFRTYLLWPSYLNLPNGLGLSQIGSTPKEEILPVSMWHSVQLRSCGWITHLNASLSCSSDIRPLRHGLPVPWHWVWQVICFETLMAVMWIEACSHVFLPLPAEDCTQAAHWSQESKMQEKTWAHSEAGAELRLLAEPQPPQPPHRCTCAKQNFMCHRLCGYLLYNILVIANQYTFTGTFIFHRDIILHQWNWQWCTEV